MPSFRRLKGMREGLNFVDDFPTSPNGWELRKTAVSAICALADKICHAEGKNGEIEALQTSFSTTRERARS